MKRIMFDTMEFDRLLEDAVTYHTLLELLTEAKVELLTTHIQRDEIMAMKDEAKKSELLTLLGHALMIETRGAILGVSRYDQARFGRDEDNNLIEQVRRNKWRDSEDSLIAATASSDADTLVTDDKPFIKRLIDTHVKCGVIGFDEFKSRLEQMRLRLA